MGEKWHFTTTHFCEPIKSYSTLLVTSHCTLCRKNSLSAIPSVETVGQGEVGRVTCTLLLKVYLSLVIESELRQKWCIMAEVILLVVYTPTAICALCGKDKDRFKKTSSKAEKATQDDTRTMELKEHLIRPGYDKATIQQQIEWAKQLRQ